MRLFTSCPWLRFLPAILLLWFGAGAQPRPDTGVKELALRVSNGNDRPWEIPAFNGGGGSVSNFKRIESWKPSSKDETVNSVDFKIAREDDIVIAHVSVRLENEKVILVGTYRLREGEMIKTEELTKFGVEPLTLKVVKGEPGFKDPLAPIMPKVENKTKAIEVVGFYQEGPPTGTFQLTLRNISGKNIVALDLFMPSPDGNGGGGQQSRGNKSHPVMLPGGVSVHHIAVSRGGRMTAGGFVPDPALQQTLIIRTVVFDDGTYEGLIGPAAEIEGQRRGLAMQRRRILELLQEPKETAVGEERPTLDDLKEQAYALSKTADASVTAELITLFPSLDEKSKGWLLQNVEAGLRDGKLEFLRYLTDFEDMQKQAAKPLDLAQWIKQIKANYEKLTTTF